MRSTTRLLSKITIIITRFIILLLQLLLLLLLLLIIIIIIIKDDEIRPTQMGAEAEVPRVRDFTV